MMAVAFTIVMLLVLFVAAVIIGPWMGWRLALVFLYRRWCVYAADADADELNAWDAALVEAHDMDMAEIWRQMLLNHPDKNEV